MQKADEILQQYWKFDQFRPLQKEIIDSVLEGRDTFALLPTGGGKSICFQVPAMVMDGITLVISPLIALMKDQVQNLEKRGIKAIAFTGNLSFDKTMKLFDNCQYGNYKFIYLSPERLQSDWVLERLKNLHLNLIAIDEAHCVSQWGHDFRPAYLKIAQLKNHFPKIPFLALTASANDRVKEDIVQQLHLNNPAVFQKSFGRENLAYMVFETEDKLYKIQQILTKNPQPSIIYVRNRKSCLEVSAQLNSLGFSSTYYHGGLPPKEKDHNMQLWMSEQVQVIVATNAFGMGIDKGNVKTVIHIQLPDNLENYYQEAGRAGRNGDKAFAVLLTNPSDIQQAQNQFIDVLPDKAFLSKMYSKLCSYLQIAYGEGINETFSFNLNHFCTKYQFPVLKSYNALLFLDRQGVITSSAEFSEKATVQFIVPSKEVIRYISLNPNQEEIILTLLRNYPGIYDAPTAVNIAKITKSLHINENEILEILHKLKEKHVIDYHGQHNDATLIFNEIREDEKTINRISKYLESQNTLKKEQFKAVLDYVSDIKNCKSRLLLKYFGEETTDCGICSYCISKKQKQNPPIDLAEKILELLQQHPMDAREIEKQTKDSPNDIIFALQQLLEKNKIKLQPNNQYTLIS